MFANAVERQSALVTVWPRLLAPNPERLEFATRVALVCALTTLVTEIYQTPAQALTAYLAFFFNRPERTPSLILSLVLTTVIAVLIPLIFFVAKLVVDDPMWRVISIAVSSFALLFFGSASKLRPRDDRRANDRKSDEDQQSLGGPSQPRRGDRHEGHSTLKRWPPR